MANSFSRAADRASSRLAKLAHPIRRTKATAPSNTNSAGRTLPVICSAAEIRYAVTPASSLYVCARRRAIVSISAWPRSMVTPGFRRAITLMKRAPRGAIDSALEGHGTQS